MTSFMNFIKFNIKITHTSLLPDYPICMIWNFQNLK